MKTTVLSAAAAALLAPLCAAQYSPFPDRDAEADQTSTTVVHKDETYTTTKRDSHKRILERQTMKKNGTVVMRSKFSLDEMGRERRGEVCDGQGNILFKSEFIYDELGNVLEERVFDAYNKPVRRLVYQADRLGRRKAFGVTYSNGRPIGDLMPLDDATPFSTTSTHAHSSTGAPGEIVRSADGSSARLSGGAVPYPGTRRSAEGGSSPKRETSSGKERRRRLRIFRR